MKVTARGWNRNMGENRIADHDLSELTVSRDQNKYLRWGHPTVFRSTGEVGVHWGQDLRYTGSYRVEVNFTQSDIVTLFKAMFGSELDVNLLEDHGFTVSPELQKSLLSKIKLADLTIGELAGLTSPEKSKEPEVAPTVRPFIRRA